MRTLLAIALVAAFATTARAEDFDPTGWKFLGSVVVQKERDKSFSVPAYSGSITELAIVAPKGSAKIATVVVTRGDSTEQTLRPDQLVERAGAPLLLSLDAEPSPIVGISIAITDVGLPTRLHLYGRDPSATARAKVDWDHTGWIELASTEIGATSMSLRTTDTSKLKAIALVSTAELEISRVGILLDDGGLLEDTQPTSLGPGEPYVVDLSQEPKPVGVRKFIFRGIITGAVVSEVTLYGLPIPQASSTVGRVLVRHGAAAAGAPAEESSKYEDLGWTLLGEDEVDLIDDEIVVGKKKRKATYRQIKVVVVGDAVKLRTLDVHLGGKKATVQSEEVEQTYGDGDDNSVVIDIPGKRRAIEKVRLQYKKHRLDASTRVQVYAR